MKKDSLGVWFFALLLGALGFLASYARATVLGYYQGEASPGRLVDGSGAGHNLTQDGDPGNPTSPSPVPEGSHWLAGGVSGGADDYSYDPSNFTLSQFNAIYSIWFWARVDSKNATGNMIQCWYVDDTVAYERAGIVSDDTHIYLKVGSSAGDEFVSANIDSYLGTEILVRIVFAATGGTCTAYINGSSVGTFTRLATLTLPVATVWLSRSGVVNGWMDAFMLATGSGDAYLGPAFGTPTITPSSTETPSVTPTITPTYTETPSITPTFTVTPTWTITKTRTVTATITPTWTFTRTITATKTPTFTSTKTITRTFTYTRTVTATKTPTRTSTPTRTISRTPTNTPVATATRTGTKTITKTMTKTFSSTVTETQTPVPTRTPRPTMTVQLTMVRTPEYLYLWQIVVTPVPTPTP